MERHRWSSMEDVYRTVDDLSLLLSLRSASLKLKIMLSWSECRWTSRTVAGVTMAMRESKVLEPWPWH